MSTDQGILFVSLSVSFGDFLQTSGVLSGLWEGASISTLHHECCSGFWPSGTFYIYVRSSGAEQEWHLSSWSCLLPRTFFSSYSWVRADGQLRDPAFPRSLSWCNPASDLGGFYSDVHGELWLLISTRGLFQINQISFRRTQIKVQKHLRDDEEQHKALSAKVQGPYQSLLMSVEHFRCTCSEVSKTKCREILHFLTTAN